MKILWLCNSVPLDVIEEFGLQNGKPESWITGIHNKIKNDVSYDVFFMFPESRAGKKIDWKKGNTHYITYPEKGFLKYYKDQELFFCDVLRKYAPDLIHIFGTEYPHSYAMINASETCGLLDNTIINIQGMASVIERHYDMNLPISAKYLCTLRDLLKFDNVYFQKKKMKKRGGFEISALKKAKHVIGRTDWDLACVKKINNRINYHFCNETLRDSFYEFEWNEEKCEKHSIFVSQCNYSVKGMHFMLESMREIIEKYPDSHLYTTGFDPLKASFLQKQRNTYYASYLAKLIKKYGLEGHVTFLGNLNEIEMRDRYLKSNVFVCCSTIENSSNSVGEAMILGVPVVASDVGGIKNLLKHNEEGYIYPVDEVYMISHYVFKVFEYGDIAKKMSDMAKKHAANTHDPKKNFEDLINIYNKIAKK